MSNAPTRPDCARHPGQVSSVVCARCDRPICTDCMVTAAVGWQCPDCVKTGAKKAPTTRVTFNRTGTGVVGATNPTPVVLGLVAVNVVVFLLSGLGKVSVLDRFGEVPLFIHQYHQYYRLFDSIFLHENVLHILFNMLALIIVAPAVEVQLGRVRFLALYLIAGFGGSVLFYLIAPALTAGVGASGAIFGVMGAYVVLAHNRRLPLQQVVGLIVINLVIGFADPNIGWQAHLGGLFTGALVAFAYDKASLIRSTTQKTLVTVGSSVAIVAVLALLVVSVAPGHVSLGG
ncbi:MAG TPA: rhomboid family intramembrane serine protease [Acidimicrobiales bacterium]|jgi:membrane associated rhomboid family serine protease